MEPQTFDFKPDTPKLSKEMQATLAKTEAALKQMWEREKREAHIARLEMIERNIKEVAK